MYELFKSQLRCVNSMNIFSFISNSIHIIVLYNPHISTRCLCKVLDQCKYIKKQYSGLKTLLFGISNDLKDKEI